MMVTSKRPITSVGSSGVADRIGSFSIATGRVIDKIMGRVIRDPAEALGETGVDKSGVDNGVDSSRAMVARSIKVSDTSETSSSTLDGMDTGGMIRRGKVIFEI